MANNSPRHLEHARAWKQKNKAKLKVYNRAYELAHPEITPKQYQQLLKRNIAWRKRNQEKVRTYDARYRAQRISLGPIRKGIIAQLLIAQNHTCRLCPADLLNSGYHLDHIIPLSKGGGNDAQNLNLLCPRCNLVKHNKIIPGLGPLLSA